MFQDTTRGIRKRYDDINTYKNRKLLSQQIIKMDSICFD